MSLSGLIGSETLNVTANSTFDNKNIGSGKTVTVNSITLANGTNGGLAANYSIATSQTTTATVTAKPLIVSGITASNKSYDTTTSVSLNTSSLSYNGLVAGDSFSGSFTSSFNDADVGTGKLISLTSTYSGDDVTNYSITDHPNIYANITIGNPTISGLTDQQKNFRDVTYSLPGIPSISGIPIQYTSSNPTVASINSTTGNVFIENVGTTTITARILSTLNYNGSTTSYVLVIKLNATNIDKISHDTIRLSNNLSQNTQGSVGSNSNIIGNNTNIKNTGTKGGAVVKAKVVVSSNGQNPTVEGIYNDESNLGEVSKEFNEEEEKERFEEPGDIIDKRNIVLKVTAGDSYNYQLELRNKGLVIKALDNSSVSFIESNKGLVIQSAISEVKSVVGFMKSQLKTIIIDIKERF